MTPGAPTGDFLPDWYPGLVGGLDFPLGWKTPCPDPVSWRTRGLQAFRARLLEDDRPMDADPQVGSWEDREGYRVARLELTLGRHRRTPALLAVPEGPGPFPAALVLHDHGAYFDLGKEKMLRPLAGHPKQTEAQDWADRNYGGRFLGDDLARRGWVVLSTDAYGWGDRARGGYEAQQALASNLLALGSSWAGVIAVEDAAAARWLASLPEVDPGRVAAVGHSLGGFRAWQVQALSDHVGACVAACCLGTVAGLMVPGGNRTRGQSAFTMTHPGLARELDFPDLAALGAPRPLWMVHGREDRLYPTTGVDRAYRKIEAVYQGFGVPKHFQGGWMPGGHGFPREDQDRAWEWLDERLPSAPSSSFLS